jgi:hypothetical protein
MIPHRPERPLMDLIGAALRRDSRCGVSRIAAVVFLVAAATASADAATITLTTYDLAANMANQTINIMVSGGDSVAGVNLELTTGDGGPLLGIGGSMKAPVITAVDLFPAGGVFAANHDPQAAPSRRAVNSLRRRRRPPAGR